MIEIFMMIAWILGIIMGAMWLFLPWIIISKIDEVITELRVMNARVAKSSGE